jgi:molybdopterin-guanine dinucleotide biosynthesis protein A
MLVGGRTALDRVCTAVAEVSDPVVVCTRVDHDAPAVKSEIEIVRDPVSDCGPMGGLLGGFKALLARGCEWGLVVACDHVLIRSKVLAALIEVAMSSRVDTTVVRAGDRVFPLLGVYRSELAVELKSRIRDGQLRMMDWLATLDVQYVDGEIFRRADADLRSLLNVNTSEDLLRVRSLVERK